MDNINVPKDLEKLLQEAKIRNEIEQNPMDAIRLSFLINVYLGTDPNNAFMEFVNEYLPKLDFKQMIAFIRAHLDFLAAVQKIEEEIDQNTKSESC